jgi:hypothetical protein
MADLFFIELILLFFGLSWGFLLLCQNLMEDGSAVGHDAATGQVYG